MPHTWKLQDRAKQAENLNPQRILGNGELLKEHTEDEHDAFIENVNLVLILSMGILSFTASALTLFQWATTVVYTQQPPTDSLEKPIFAALLLILGYAALYLFRKRRESRRNKQSALFLKTKA